ncbi:MAG: hypothetical protein ACRD8W_10865 [Nitrososphaeraceae archaeon]
MNSSAYETNLDLFIQYFWNPTIRDRSRSQLERIARELVEIRVRANETRRTAGKGPSPLAGRFSLALVFKPLPKSITIFLYFVVRFHYSSSIVTYPMRSILTGRPTYLQ